MYGIRISPEARESLKLTNIEYTISCSHHCHCGILRFWKLIAKPFGPSRF